MRRILVPILVVLATLMPVTSASADSIGSDHVTPGIGLFQFTPDAATRYDCTLAFLVRTSQGSPAALTAGHCYHQGAMAPETWYTPDNTMKPLGAYRLFVNGGTGVDDDDIALIDIASPVPLDPRLWGRYPVQGVVGRSGLEQYPNLPLCKTGATSRLSCGKVVRLTDTKVWFEAPSEHGDSGSPVVIDWHDGTVSAVAVLDGSPVGQDGTITAELIEPWMARWGLTLA